jgi:hypothetical protein
MTLVVEDGHGLPTANAYIDVAFADAYFSLRGITAWASAVSADKEIAIVKATDYIDTVWGWKFLGTKANAKTNPPDFAVDQALEWPRMYQRQDLPIALPPQLQKACAEYALRALLNATPLLPDPEVQANGLQITSTTDTVGPITTSATYLAAGSIDITRPYPAADLLLKKLVRASGTAIRG